MDFVAELRAGNRALVGALADIDPDLPVPACPGWSARNLLTHVGRGDRWAATIVRTRADGPVDPRSVEGGKPPAGHAEALAWLAEGAEAVIGAVAADPEVEVWTMVGPRPARWWVRRRLHEALVHTADVRLAVDEPVEADPAVAADGVAEWLSLLADGGVPALDDGVTLHLHATDADGEWTVRRDGAGVVWEPAHTKATTALRGPAMDLLLVLLRRFPLDRVEVHGDRAVAEGFRDRSPF